MWTNNGGVAEIFGRGENIGMDFAQLVHMVAAKAGISTYRVYRNGAEVETPEGPSAPVAAEDYIRLVPYAKAG